MRKYRVGIIGCGPRAHQHAEALRQMPEAELVGAADRDAERLEPFCRKWEIPGAYPTSAALLEAGGLDAVTIVTLPEDHLPLVIECAQAGVPFLNCEKVVAYHLDELDTMIRACEAAGALLTVNHQMRFLPHFRALRDVAASGRLGEIRYLRAGSRGSLTEQGSHVVDQMLFLNEESPAEWVLGQADGREGFERKHQAPSSTAGTVRFANGAIGTFLCGLLSPEVTPGAGFWLQKFVEVTGTRGWGGAYVNGGWRALLDTGEVLGGEGTWEPNWPAQAELFREGFRWLDDRDHLHPCRAEIARKGLEVLLAACQSSRERAAVPLPLHRRRDPLFELKGLLGPSHGVE